MTRTQVEIRLTSPRKSTKKSGPPPSYQQAQSLPNGKLNSAAVVPFPALMRSRRSVDGSFRDDETESYADSFESEDGEDENGDEEHGPDDAEDEDEGEPADNEPALAPSEGLNAAQDESVDVNDVVEDASEFSSSVDEEHGEQDASLHQLQKPTPRVKTTKREREC